MCFVDYLDEDSFDRISKDSLSEKFHNRIFELGLV